jgi:hypothetical protein
MTALLLAGWILAAAPETQVAPADPCAWLPVAEVEKVLGKLEKPPGRVRSVEKPKADPQGLACLYTLVEKPKRGPGEIALMVNLSGDFGFEAAGAMMGNLFRNELNKPHPEKPAAPKWPGWDHAKMYPPHTFVGRAGHLGIAAGARTLEVPADKLAAALRDRIPDQPFAVEAPSPVSQPDPCKLLTRAEAEGVLGKLAVAPFRSSGNSALADPGGPGCTFYAAKHRALTLVPTWSDGKALFQTVSGANTSAGNALKTGAADIDAIDGPWDRAAQPIGGGLLLQKGDRMLEVHFKSAQLELAAAAKLAALAIPRLAEVKP